MIYKVLALIVLVVASAAVYAPGLSGPFLLDDENNLRPLGATGPIDSARDLGRYVFSGESSPIGRPLTLLSFAANAQNWPADPWWFKLTNVAIHLVSGLLVFVLVWMLAVRVGRNRGPPVWLALAAAALWLLHPIQISSVLYISQRMNLLASLFVLAALIVYLRGRAIGQQRPVAGCWLQSLAVCVGGLLAVLSKETGVLLPLFILVIEATLLHPRQGQPRPRYWRWWSLLFVWLPLMVLTVYVVHSWQHFYFDYQMRAVTLKQRVLTEPRVMMDYLGLIFAPFWHAVDLFQDDYVVSRGWIQPTTVLPALGAVTALLGAGFGLRARQPVLAFAILWFFAGHVLEASLLGLEPACQYRNYLPLLGPAFALAWYAVEWFPGRHRLVGPALLVALCLGLGYQTFTVATLWGNKLALAQDWAHRHPKSNRAQHYLAKVYLQRNEYYPAYLQMQKAEKRLPDDVSVELELLYLRCYFHRVLQRDMQAAFADAAKPEFHNSVFGKLWQLNNQVRQGTCPLLDRSAMLKLLQILLDNRYYAQPSVRARLLYRRALLLSEMGRTDAAAAQASKSFAIRHDPSVAYDAAQWLLQAGQPQQALKYIGMARAAAAPRSWTQRWFADPAVQAGRDQTYQALAEQAHRAMDNPQADGAKSP